jgi:hypothetical protein
MDEKQFRKHLADLAHGHHHPDEHDWDEGTVEKADKLANIASDESGSAVTGSNPKPAKKRSRKK